MIICETIVHLLAIVQNKLRFFVWKRVNLKFLKVVATYWGEAVRSKSVSPVTTLYAEEVRFLKKIEISYIKLLVAL